jgi:hypothetical protein
VDPFESFEYRGLTIELHTYDSPHSPADWDTLGTLHVRGWGRPDWEGWASEAYERGDVPLLVRYARMSRGLYLVPVQYDDRGAMYALDADDSGAGCNGYIVTDDARVAELCGDGAEYHTIEWVTNALKSEVDEWHAYVSGDVVGYVVRDANGADIDSCWGFYPEKENHVCAIHGDVSPCYSCPQCGNSLQVTHRDRYEYVRTEAREAADWEANERERAAAIGIPTVGR